MRSPRRFRPKEKAVGKLANADGETHWLVVEKDDATGELTFEFLPDTKENEKKASDSATAYYNKAEGIDFSSSDSAQRVPIGMQGFQCFKEAT